MEANAIRDVEIIGIHGQYDLRVRLGAGLNIIYGQNGSGKTTFLHVLANLVGGDIERFCHIQFKRIAVTTFQGTRIELHQLRGENVVSVRLDLNGSSYLDVSREGEIPVTKRAELVQLLGGRPVYLPAFRSVLEAISRTSRYPEESRKKEFEALVKWETEDPSITKMSWHSFVTQDRSRNLAYKTMLCRDWFGPFVPVVRCPSLWEVSDELVTELQEAQFDVASTDRRAFADVFVHVLEGLLSQSVRKETESAEALLSKIDKHLKHSEVALMGEADVYHNVYASIKQLVQGQSKSIDENIAPILMVYEKALNDRSTAVKQAFSRIRTFEASVNKFLKGKTLKAEDLLPFSPRTRRQTPPLISLANGQKTGLSVLSSGERQVLTLLFSATHMSSTDGIVLIDEPELSLHVNWQRIILKELTRQAISRQVVTCTHAPEIGSDHRDCMTELLAQASTSGEPLQRDIFETPEST